MSGSANLILTNARVVTVDPQQPSAEAVVVSGNRIAYVGSSAGAESWRRASTRVVDARQRTVMPGFIDSHAHLLLGSAELSGIELREVVNYRDLRDIVREYARKHPELNWLTGAHLRYNLMPGGRRLNRHDLDAIIADRPLCLHAYDYHTVWANTCALELAGLLHGAEITAGEIVMGEDGLATGELREPAAYSHMLARTETYSSVISSYGGLPSSGLSAQDQQRLYDLLTQGLHLASRLGITSIHNMDGDARTMQHLDALDARGELPVRMSVPYSVTPETPREALSEAVAMREKHRGDKIRSGFCKFFMDGVIESGTAFLLDDYVGFPGYRGSALFEPDQFVDMLNECDRFGLQVSTHAIGDGAIRRTLDGYEAILRTNGHRDRRNRIEHIEVLHPDDLERFGRLGVIASMQPMHPPYSNPKAVDSWPQLVGTRRWRNMFRWQDIRDTGATLVFGSDWPVFSNNPIQGLHSATNRQPYAHGLPDQRQRLEDAVISYTRDAAFAEFQEHQKGQLRAGMLADIVLLSADLAEQPLPGIGDIQVIMTICDGQVSYENDAEIS